MQKKAIPWAIIGNWLVAIAMMLLIPLHAVASPKDSTKDSSKSHRAAALNGFRSKIARLQMPFIANEGQISAKQVKYYAKTFAGTLYVTEQGELVYALPHRSADKKNSAGWGLKEYLVGDVNIALQALDRSKTKFNYYIGNDPAKWKTNIATYNELSLGEVYAGIDLRLRAYGSNVEKIFTLSPGKTPEVIKLKMEGAIALEVNAAGELVAQTGLGPVTFSKPIAYQEIDGKRKSVEVAYRIKQNTYGFSVGNYDARIPLIIDPLIHSTYLGGSSSDQANDVAVDSSTGDVFVVGTTLSGTGFPGISSSPGSDNNVFVAKLDSALGALSVSTLLGGNDDSEGNGIALNTNGSNVYVTGATLATNFATGGWDVDRDVASSNYDVFVALLDSSLNLTRSTYLDGTVGSPTSTGTTSDDKGHSITYDTNLEVVFVCGETKSTDFPGVTTGTGGAFDQSHPGSGDIEGFAAKLSNDLSSAPTSTFLGGTSTDIARDLAVSGSFVYITGYTNSTDFPTDGSPLQSSSGGNDDIFVTKLTTADLSDTNAASTYLGGGENDHGYGIAVDTSGNAYVTGYSESTTDYPTAGSPYQSTHGNSGGSGPDVIVSKLNSGLSSLSATTFLGGSSSEYGQDIVLDSSGNPHIIGYSYGTGYPTTTGAHDTSYNGTTDADWILSKLNSNLSALTYSTYLGGSHSSGDYGRGIALDSSGNMFGAGYTYSTDMPIQSYQASNAGSNDAFVASFSITSPTVSSTSPSSGATNVAVNSTVTATFSTTMDGTTITTSTFTVTDASGPSVSGSVSYSGSTATFTPSADLSNDTTYSATITTGAQDTNGVALASDHTWSFTTVAATPTVSSTSPSDGATNVAVNSDITASFSTTMDSTTITTSTFTVEDSTGTAVSGSVTYNPTATFNPTQDLATNTTYTATITTGAKSAGDIALASDYSWSFTTSSAPNTPSGTSPADLTQMTGTSVTLEGSTFDDPDAGDTHSESQLRVRMAGQPYGKSSYPDSFTQTLTSGSLTAFTVSGLVDGMKYYWQIRYKDLGGTYSAWSAEIGFIVGTSIPDNSVVIGAGSSAYDFQMVSFSQFPDDPSVTSILGLSTPLDTTNYRIGTYDPLSGSYVEYDSGLEIEPGRGYWFLCRNGLSITVNGIPCTTTQAAEVELKYNSATGDGWNMIGSPNSADYTWSEVQIVVYDTSGNIVYGPASIGSLASGNPYINVLLYRYLNDGLYYSDTTRVEEYKGFWVEVKQGNVYLRFTSGAQVARGASGLKVMLAGLFDRAHRWSRKWILATPVAMANGGGPPAPPGDFYSPRTAAAGGGGCFIATAAYGSPLMPHVQILRAFRDRFLGQTRLGNFLVKAYYRYSPPMAHYVTQHKNVKQMVRLGLLPVVAMAWMGLKLGPAAFIVLVSILMLTVAGFLFRRTRRG